MLEILISSTVLILALTALRFLLRGKLNPRLQYARSGCSPRCGSCCRSRWSEVRSA